MINPLRRMRLKLSTILLHNHINKANVIAAFKFTVLKANRVSYREREKGHTVKWQPKTGAGRSLGHWAEQPGIHKGSEVD